jgi:hypothetical protein
MGDALSDLSQIQAVIVPALKIDQSGFRLGQGGGYYDRALVHLDAWKIGLVYAGELSSETLPHESHDVPLEDITSLLEPFPPHELNAYPISAEIKSPKAKGLDLLKPTGQRVFAEYDYELYQELQLEGMGSTQARKRANEI